MNKRFRSAQKQVDREVSHVQLSTNELEKTLQKRSPTLGEIRALLGGMVEKLNLLKRKVRVLKKRIVLLDLTIMTQIRRMRA